MAIVDPAIMLPGAIRCAGCNSPALRIEGQNLIIEHKHHGERHTTVIPLSYLVDKVTTKNLP